MQEAIARILLTVLTLFLLSVAAETETPSPKGYVPDEATAVRIAEAVLIPIYGLKHVRSERPFKARLEGDYWIVSGSLPKPRNHDEIIVGGTAGVDINRASGCIRSVYHLK